MRSNCRRVHQRRHPPVVTLGLVPRVQGQVTERLPWMLGAGPSMTTEYVSKALRTREKRHG